MTPIDTLDLWNSRLSACGCCQMPVCPTPVLICEVKTASADACGVVMSPAGADCPDNCKRWKSRVITKHYTRTSTPIGEWTTRSTTLFTRDAEGNCDSATTDEVIDGEVGDDAFGTRTDFTAGWAGSTYTADETFVNGTIHTEAAFTDPETLATLGAVVDAKIADLDWESGGCAAVLAVSSYSCAGSADLEPECPSSLTKTLFRYRFQIPSSHTGSYFKIEADEVLYPADWEEEGGTLRSIVNEQSIEWTGPGSGEPDDPSWFTDWIEVDAPTDPGSIQIRNIAFTCYHGTHHGAKPQYTGDTFIPG
jgi:hypothetical protein